MSDLALADSKELAMVDEEQLVTMMVDGQAFGIPILMVQDIVEPDQITPVPLAPGAIAGVLNLRGRIVTVIDMRELLGSGDIAEHEKQMSVTVEYKGDLYTFLVDSIGDVHSLPRKHFDKPPATLDDQLRRLCSGVFRLENDLLVVLDVERMLDEETIMKTPRRTRRRRKVVKAEDVANENGSADGEAEDAGKKSESAPAKASGAIGSIKSTSIKSKADSKVKPASSLKKPAVKSASKSAPKPKTKPVTKPASAAKPAPKTVSKAPAASSRGPAASGTKADNDQKAMLAVENFAARAEMDNILSDFVSPMDPAKMLDLLVNMFDSFYQNPGAPLADTAFKNFVDQPNLGDDHFMAIGMGIHQTLMELETAPDIIDNAMSVIDEVRLRIMG